MTAVVFVLLRDTRDCCMFVCLLRDICDWCMFVCLFF